jgi:hypothetical protein
MLPPDAFDARLWESLPDADLAAVRVPTMLRPAERRLYLWLARDWASGAGAMVDLGCFAGGSTALLAEGQRQAGRAVPVHGYDTFTVSDRFKDQFLYPAGVPAFDGEDMLPVARALLAPWADTVRLHPGRIEATGWDGGPIEILAMDASKTAATADAMAAAFLPALVPGRGIVIQQDYLHWKQPWIGAQMALFGDCFAPVAYAPKDTVVFRCLRVPGPDEIAAAATAHLDDTAMIAALRLARDRLAPLGIVRGIRRLIEAVRANPGVRAAWSMKHAPNPAPTPAPDRRNAP